MGNVSAPKRAPPDGSAGLFQQKKTYCGLFLWINYELYAICGQQKNFVSDTPEMKKPKKWAKYLTF